jgi:hypothetical protein
MHKRIQELAKQATERFGVKIWDESAGMFYTETHLKLNQEKFAELIVKECAYLNFRSTGVTTDGEIAIGNMILKHFGVEE